jgi:hypothetical protein
MTNSPPSLNGVQQGARKEIKDQSPLVQRIARLGYTAKGVVYIIIGFLAVQVAFSAGGKLTDNKGALEVIFHAPFGQFLLGLVAVGLAFYALWRLTQALVDPESRKTGESRPGTRFGFLISGLGYAVLAYTAFAILIGAQSKAGSGRSAAGWSAEFMAHPPGVWVVALVGAILTGIAVGQFVRACRKDPADKLKTQEMTVWMRRSSAYIGRFGYASRGVVFGIIGIFLIDAAKNFDPQKAVGLSGALEKIAEQSYGPIMLGVVAAGLAAYGLFQFVEARYRRIEL